MVPTKACLLQNYGDCVKCLKILPQQLEHHLWLEEFYADYIISNAFIQRGKSLDKPYILQFVMQMPTHYKT